MRRVLLTLSLPMLVCGCIEARIVIVEVGNIRSNHRNILVMARSGEGTKPVCSMARSEKEKVTVRLESVDWEEFDLSVFRDENENWQMDMLEGKEPVEGYALKSYEVKDKGVTFELKLCYPVNQ